VLRKFVQRLRHIELRQSGYAFPTLIGAKVAAPHRPAISYAGDGA
jgi:thiamine pyrophosphate-dependent acetolactate synthase large subunit-like protein